MGIRSTTNALHRQIEEGRRQEGLQGHGGHRVRAEYRRIETKKEVRGHPRQQIAKYQNWKYSLGDQVDFFENTVNPKKTRGTIIQKYWTPNIR